MRKLWLASMIILLGVCRVSISRASCSGHGGPAGCDPASGTVLCADGTLDKRVLCSRHRRNPKTRVLKLKPPTTNRGQILSPGQKPPDTSIENSK